MPDHHHDDPTSPSEPGHQLGPGDHRGPSPQEAAEALGRAERARVGEDRDRAVLARGTIVSGLAMGAYLGILMALDRGSDLGLLAMVAFVVLLGAVSLWQRRAARSVPRGTRRTVNRAGLATIGVGLVGIVVLNGLQLVSPASLPVAIGFGLVVAAPLVVAGLLIGRDGAAGPPTGPAAAGPSAAGPSVARSVAAGGAPAERPHR